MTQSWPMRIGSGTSAGLQECQTGGNAALMAPVVNERLGRRSREVASVVTHTHACTHTHTGNICVYYGNNLELTREAPH